MCILSLATHDAAGEHVLQSRKKRVKKYWQRLHRVAALEGEAAPSSPVMDLELTGSGCRRLKEQRSVTFSLDAPDEMTYFCEVPYADEDGICSDDE